jgi:hypothetical protein
MDAPAIDIQVGRLVLELEGRTVVANRQRIVSL